MPSPDTFPPDSKVGRAATSGSGEGQRSPRQINQSWVWSCSDASIAKGQKSVLALVEIPVAMAIWGGIAQNTSWPWVTLIAVLAIPLLLLRSQESVEAGVRALGRYWTVDEASLSPQARHLLFFSGVVTGALCTALLIWWLSYYLRAQLVWIQFWQATALGAFAFACGSAGARGITGDGSDLGAFVGAFLGVVGGTLAFAIYRVDVVSGVGVFFGAMVYLVVGGLVSGRDQYGVLLALINLLSWPGQLIGFFVRILIIRVKSTCQFFVPGLRDWFANCRETLIYTDVTHLPSLLPKANSVEEKFGLEYWIRKSAWRKDTGDDVFENVVGNVSAVAMVLLIYLPAMAYRINIKAAAWLWGSLAWFLRPRRWDDFERMRKSMGWWVHWTTQTLVVPVALLAFVWTLPRGLIAQFPERLMELIPDNWREAPAIWPDICSIRGVLTIFLAMTLLMLWFRSVQAYMLHKKAWESAKEYKGDVESQESWREDVVQVYFWQRVNLILAVLWVWAWALWLAGAGPWKGRFAWVVWMEIVPWL